MHEGSAADRAPLWNEDCNNLSHQRFALLGERPSRENPTGGAVALQARHSGMFVSVPDYTAVGAAVLQQRYQADMFWLDRVG
ncbi:hypothetical protein [Embleya sp. AB8]|uniref:hypothetical protein n=1 Tax=Embleya sp. AB8 TaxID=3156304 RepID=UPI003C74885B